MILFKKNIIDTMDEEIFKFWTFLIGNNNNNNNNNNNCKDLIKTLSPTGVWI